MISILDGTKKIVEGTKFLDGFLPTGIASGCAVVVGVILTLLSKKFPIIKEFLKLVCKTVFGGKECSEKQNKTKKVKTSKK